MVEQGVRDAGIGLVHANDVTAGGKFAGSRRGRLGFFFFLLLFFPFAGFLGFLRGQRHGESGFSVRNFNGLLLQDVQKLRLQAGPWIVGGQYVRGRAFGAGFHRGALGF